MVKPVSVVFHFTMSVKGLPYPKGRYRVKVM